MQISSFSPLNTKKFSKMLLSYMLQFIYSSSTWRRQKSSNKKSEPSSTPLCDTHAKAHNAYEKKIWERWKCIKLLWIPFFTYKHRGKETLNFILNKITPQSFFRVSKKKYSRIKIYATAANANSKALSPKFICIFSHGMIKNWQKYVHKISKSLIPFLNPHSRTYRVKHRNVM